MTVNINSNSELSNVESFGPICQSINDNKVEQRISSIASYKTGTTHSMTTSSNKLSTRTVVAGSNISSRQIEAMCDSIYDSLGNILSNSGKSSYNVDLIRDAASKALDTAKTIRDGSSKDHDKQIESLKYILQTCLSCGIDIEKQFKFTDDVAKSAHSLVEEVRITQLLDKKINTTWNIIRNFFNKLFNSEKWKDFDKLKNGITALQKETKTNDDYLRNLGFLLVNYCGTSDKAVIIERLKDLLGEEFQQLDLGVIKDSVDSYFRYLASKIKRTGREAPYDPASTTGKTIKEDSVVVMDIMKNLGITPEDVLRDGISDEALNLFGNYAEPVFGAIVDQSIESVSELRMSWTEDQLTEASKIHENFGFDNFTYGYLAALLNNSNLIIEDLQKSQDYPYLNGRFEKILDSVSIHIENFLKTNSVSDTNISDRTHSRNFDDFKADLEVAKKWNDANLKQNHPEIYKRLASAIEEGEKLCESKDAFDATYSKSYEYAQDVKHSNNDTKTVNT